jgi:two-component system, chemotaxis family, protein-glutamate methylesterase/glutaminase
LSGHDVIVIGASAGGVEALQTIVGALPVHMRASIFVVLHIPPQGPSLLPHILSRVGPLPAHQPADGERLQQGHIYVAPPDHHVLVETDCIRVVRGPRENRTRPAIDPLFRSAARAFGPRVVGVVCTGSLDDGTSGLQAIKARGGVTLVQDPAEAMYPSMPLSAIRNVAVDHVLPIAEIGPLLARLVAEPAPDEAAFPMPRDMALEIQLAEGDMDPINAQQIPGAPSVFACPECHGTLFEVQDGELLRFRCRVGHAYSSDSMEAEHTDSLEAALWAALRALEESAALARRLGEQAEKLRGSQVAARYLTRAAEREQQAGLLRRVLAGQGPAIDETA